MVSSDGVVGVLKVMRVLLEHIPLHEQRCNVIVLMEVG
jgi:hypothetical protein